MNKKDILSQYFAELGKRGGSKGGLKAAENMTAKERSERARKAAAKSAEVRSAKTKEKRKLAKRLGKEKVNE